MGKSPERYLKKLKKKLEKLEKRMKDKSRSRSRHTTQSPQLRRSRTRSRSPITTIDSTEEYQTLSIIEDEKENTMTENASIDLTTEEIAVTTEDVDSEFLALLGNYPQKNTYGPDLLPSVVTRWEAIIKKGLEKEQRKELIKKYPPPLNFKMMDAPKLNPEALAAAGENVLKRDKAIELKQRQVSCAISALGLALNNLSKSAVDNKENIVLISDAARLLCDYHHNESVTRKNFILTGLDKSTKDSIKDTNIDEWLFGTDFAEKLKASKAIKRSSQDLRAKNIHTHNKNQANNNHLNFRGTTTNYFKPKPQRTHARVSTRHYNNQMKTSQPVKAQPNSFRNKQQNQQRHH